MYALALTPSAERTTIDRHVLERVAGERGARARADRIEIIAPSREDARAGARRFEQAAADAAQFATWQEDVRRARHAGRPLISMAFAAQFVAQQQPGKAAHVEDWRGARTAYTNADALAGERTSGSAISILI